MHYFQMIRLTGINIERRNSKIQNHDYKSRKWRSFAKILRWEHAWKRVFHESVHTLHPQIFLHIQITDYTRYTDRNIIHFYRSRVHVFSFRVFLFFRFVKMFRDIPNRTYMSTSSRRGIFLNYILVFFFVTIYYIITQKKFVFQTRKRVNIP